MDIFDKADLDKISKRIGMAKGKLKTPADLDLDNSGIEAVIFNNDAYFGEVYITPIIDCRKSK